MAVTDEDLQKLGKPPILQWKGGRMERMELRDEELRVPSVHARSSTVDRCGESSCEPQT